MTEGIKPNGSYVTFETNGAGGPKTYSGTIVAYVPRGVSLEEAYPETAKIPLSRFVGQPRRTVHDIDRYVIEVERPGGRVSNYYVRNINMIN